MARRCAGVLTSTRGSGVSPSTFATSTGNKGRATLSPMRAINGISTVSSIPYMCCEGTVPTIQGIRPWPASGNAAQIAWTLQRVLSTTLPQRLACRLGWPVLPEVNPIIATCPAGTAPRSPTADPTGASGPSLSRSLSARTRLPGYISQSDSTTWGARDCGNSVVRVRPRAAT